MNIVMSRLYPSPVVRRIAVVGFAAAALFTGCLGRTTMAPARASAQPDNRHVEPSSAELGTMAARIVSLNSEHEFVVIDFMSRVVPAVGTRVNVYHQGKRVGAVRITEPVRAQLATADIVEGEVHVGDEAR
jgi:hypothetical protein